MAISPFFQLSSSSFSESYDDILIQCSMDVKNAPKERDTHICQKENFDDDFEYRIVEMAAPFSGKIEVCKIQPKNDFCF
jgi:hypothetical protein